MAVIEAKFNRPDDVAEIGYVWQFTGLVADPVPLDTALLGELIRDVIGAALVQGTGITVTVNDGADTITIATTITQYTDEMARDALGTALTAGNGITVTPNDGADTITIAATIDTLDELTDVAITAPTTGDVLRHNGAGFVNAAGLTHFEAAGAVATHEADTTSVHGIADTSTLYRSGGTDVAVADGGTGSSTAGGARTNLGLVIGTNVQAYDAQLDDFAALVGAQGDVIYFNGTNWVKLVAGTSGHFLKTNGAGANPAWAAASAGAPSSFKIYKAQNFR